MGLDNDFKNRFKGNQWFAAVAYNLIRRDAVTGAEQQSSGSLHFPVKANSAGIWVLDGTGKWAKMVFICAEPVE